MNKILIAIAGIALFVGIIVLFNFSFWLFEGDSRMSKLEDYWWGGYYETQMLGRQWCVARFKKKPDSGYLMALISSVGPPDIFQVKRDSSSKSFVYLTLIGPNNMVIKAKQLYYGKRYIWQRLMVGRLKDFWKRNEDIRIEGKFLSNSSPNEFSIEPLNDDRLDWFWKTYVRPDQPLPSPFE
jgi:hypothetical protein